MDKKKYETIKTAVKNLEEKNYQNLILFRSGKEWYKMGGNSLLIYLNKIAPQLKIKPNIQPDTDYTKIIFEDGLISFRGIENLRTKLERLKVLGTVKENEGMVIFELTFKVDIAQLKNYKVELYDERERTLKTLTPEITVAPRLYGDFRHLQKRIFEIVRKMGGYEREYNGNLMAEYSRKIIKYYLMMNAKMVNEKNGWKEILNLVKMLMMELTFAMELKYVNPDVGARISGELIEIRRGVEKEIGRIEDERRKAE